MTQLTSGPELDAKVAEACGWRSALVEVRGTTICVLQDFSAPLEFLACFSPRQDLNAAFAAAEKVGLFRSGLFLYFDDRVGWHFGMMTAWPGGEAPSGTGDGEKTPELAICRAVIGEEKWREIVGRK